MSYKTLEVELENGHVHPTGAESLPARATALLTILAPTDNGSSADPAVANGKSRSFGAALRALNVQGRGEFTDLSTNKRHLDDFGK